MTLLGMDIGTTHCKVGLFDLKGRALYIASLPTPVLEWVPANRIAYPAMNFSSSAGPRQVYDPIELWETVRSLLRQSSDWLQTNCADAPVEAVGVASMAETGLLVDDQTGQALTPMLPWYDPVATAQAEALRQCLDVRERFLKTGLRPAYKYSLMKILWLMEQEAGAGRLSLAAATPATLMPSKTGGQHKPLLEEARWLSAADYIAYRLTGKIATDYSLASRTYAFRIDTKTWDVPELESRAGTEAPGLVGILPPARPATTVVGRTGAPATELGLPPGTPVVIAGHDHVCGSFAALAGAWIQPGTTPPYATKNDAWGATSPAIFNSIGTAESLMGVIPERSLTEDDYQGGFTFGLHVIPGAMYWMGGLSAAGGSLEWLRALYGDPPLEYAELDALLPGSPRSPTGILFFPYLAGSGSPHSDSLARGAFVGLSSSHSRRDLYQAVLEGTAYEIEFMRRAAQKVAGEPTSHIVAAGGGTHNRRWMQIKADVLGCRVEVLEMQETTLLGAALLAGIGAGMIAGPEEVRLDMPVTTFVPDAGRHVEYQKLFEGYMALQEPLRSYYRDAGSL
jgi:sugar (pentulose or hexulose) kinase